MIKYKRYGNQLAHRVVFIEAYGSVPKGWVVHHIDYDKRNNEINNLIAMPERVHTKLHRYLADRRNNRPFDRQQTIDFLEKWKRITPSLWE